MWKFKNLLKNRKQCNSSDAGKKLVREGNEKGNQKIVTSPKPNIYPAPQPRPVENLNKNNRQQAIELEEQQVKIQWILIAKKMPDSGKCILISSNLGGVAEGAWNSNKQYFKQCRWNAIVNDVTHWAELPKPPCV